MTAPSARLQRRIRRDFGDHADDVVAQLGLLPETSQDPERIQAAVVLRADGDHDAFLSELDLVRLDWRDTLMDTGLEHADWHERLDVLLG